MTKDDYKQFAMQMAALAETYESGREISKERVEIYFQVLKHFTIEEVTAGINHVFKTRVYDKLPKPAEIIMAIRGKEEDRALSAWIDLDKAVKSIGHYESVKFEDPVIHSIVQHWGGWQRVCMFTEYEWQFRQKDFMKLYPVFAGRDSHPQYLIGEFEAHNRNRFPEHVDPPQLVESEFGRTQQVLLTDGKDV